jgi:hypothetical protein
MPNLTVKILQKQVPDARTLYTLMGNSSGWRTAKDERGLGDLFKQATRHPLVKQAFLINDANSSTYFNDSDDLAVRANAVEAMLKLAEALEKGSKEQNIKDPNAEKAAQIYAFLSINPYALGLDKNYPQMAYDGLKRLYGEKGPLADKSVYQLVEQRAKEYNILLANSNAAAAKIKEAQLKAAQEAKEEEKVVQQAAVVDSAPSLPPVAELPQRLEAAIPGNAISSDQHPVSASVMTAPTLGNVSNEPATSPKKLSVSIPGTPKSTKAEQKLPESPLAQNATEISIDIIDVMDPQRISTPSSQLVTPTFAPSPVANIGQQANDKVATPVPPVSPKDKPATPVAGEDKHDDVPANDKVATPVPPTSPKSAPASPVSVKKDEQANDKVATPVPPVSPKDKPATPVAGEEKHDDAQANDKVATPMPPVSPKDKPATPVASEDKHDDVPANDKVATPVPPVSPKDKPATPVAGEDKHDDVPLNDKVATPVPPKSPKSVSPADKPVSPAATGVSQADAKNSDLEDIFANNNAAPGAPAEQANAPAPAPKFAKVEALLDKLTAIATKHPAIGATKAIKDEQMALFGHRTDKKTLLISPEIKALTYEEATYLSNHMNNVQLRAAADVDTRFDHLRTEAGSVRKHVGDGKGETKTWRDARMALKIQILLLVTAEARAQQVLEAQAAEAAKAAATAEPVPATAEAAPAPAQVVDPAANATAAANTKLKLNAARYAEVENLLGQYTGRPYGMFGHRGTPDSKAFFKANFEPVQPAQDVDQANKATNSPRR